MSRLLRVMFVTCISFPISIRNAEEAFAGIVLCFSSCFHAVRTKKRSCVFQMFSIQYFILHPKTLRFPCCRSFFGQRIGWRKAKRSPDSLYPTLFDQCVGSLTSHTSAVRRDLRDMTTSSMSWKWGVCLVSLVSYFVNLSLTKMGFRKGFVSMQWGKWGPQEDLKSSRSIEKIGQQEEHIHRLLFWGENYSYVLGCLQ